MPASSRRLILALLAMMLLAATVRASDLTEIEKTIGKQPAYDAEPRYCLLLIGETKLKVWIVEDGKKLYVDRNANGDLTDDGPPIQPSEVRNLGSTAGRPPQWDFDYVLEGVKPESGPSLTDFRLRRWNYGEKQDSYGLSLTLHEGKIGEPGPNTASKLPGKPSAGSAAPDAQDGGISMYAGWFGTMWADSPAKASMIHFGGPLEPRLLREKEFILDSETRGLSVCLITPGVGEAGPARLSEYAIPISNPIYARIEWPVGTGSPPLVTLHKLGEHCCYWEYYDSGFCVPQGKGVIEGTATVTFEVPGGKFPLPVRTNKIEVRVRMPKPSDSSTK